MGALTLDKAGTVYGTASGGGFRAKGLDSFVAQTNGERFALAAASDYVENFGTHRTAGRCLVFSGNVGTGKTHLACAIAAALVRRKQRVRYLTVSELIRKLRSCWDRGAHRKEADYLIRNLNMVIR